MPRLKTFYLCSECGFKSAKWLGRCPQCDSWNTFVEEVEQETTHTHTASTALQPLSLEAVDFSEADRVQSGLSEFDRVVGGLVPGQAILISGEPGVGKSTLLLQLAREFARRGRVYYVNGEESNAQVKSRAERLGIKEKELFLLSSNNLEEIIARLQSDRPSLCIVDSIQTLHSERFTSLPGSIVQARECSFELIQAAKTLNIPLFLVSHITKSGSIAGPKVVEHMVDSVLFLESDERGLYRILRSLKNRFFSTDEAGFFQMGALGLLPVEDLGHAFVNIHEKPVAGVSTFPYLEGNRVIPVEVQALCVPTQFNYPRRTADGLELNRLQMLLAILEKHLGLNYSAQDVYLNITGGLRINDPALDLAVIMALRSSLSNKPLPADSAWFGELGLASELRPIKRTDRRIQELARMGFHAIYFPAGKGKLDTPPDTKLYPLRNLQEMEVLIK